MIISCPGCRTSFFAPQKALGAEGRNVRCSKCKLEWFQEPEDAQEIPKALQNEAVAPAEDEFTPRTQNHVEEDEGPSVFSMVREKFDEKFEIARQKYDAVDPENRKLFSIGFGAVLVLFLLIIVPFRMALVHASPAFNSFYQVVGLSSIMPSDKLVLADVTYEFISNDLGEDVYFSAEPDEYVRVKGQVVNPTLSRRFTAPVRIRVEKDDQGVLDEVIVAPENKLIEREGFYDFTVDLKKWAPYATIIVELADEKKVKASPVSLDLDTHEETPSSHDPEEH